MNKINKLYNQLKQNKGFTVSADLETHHKQGYCIATEGNETQVIETSLDLNTFESILAVYKALQGNSNLCLGSWLDEGKVYFDLTEIVTDKDQAIKLGKDRKQLAIFNLETKETIYL